MSTTDPALAALLARLRPELAEPPALPTLREDVNYLEAEAVKQAYVAAVAAANRDPSLTDVYRAAAIVRAWTACVDRLAQLREELDARRNARMEWIGRTLPLGPGIPPGTSPADATVLRAAFVAAYERARASSEDDRRQQLEAAERWDDDAARRGVLTACLDESLWNTVNRWAEQHNPAAGALIAEFKALSELVTGYTGNVDTRFEAMQFAPPPKPAEVAELPRLVATHNATVRANNGSHAVRSGQAAGSGTVLDVAQLLA